MGNSVLCYMKADGISILNLFKRYNSIKKIKKLYYKDAKCTNNIWLDERLKILLLFFCRINFHVLSAFVVANSGKVIKHKITSLKLLFMHEGERITCKDLQLNPQTTRC